MKSVDYNYNDACQFRRLIAVDPSLRSSGWVLFDIYHGSILDCGIISALGVNYVLASRFEDLQIQITKLFRQLCISNSDILVVEGPAPLVLNPNTAVKVEQVRGIFESVARSMGALVPGRVNPRTVQTELFGLKGPQLPRKQIKAMATQVATRLFGETLANLINSKEKSNKKKTLNQDIVDASLIGTLALSRIKFCQQTHTDLCKALSEGNKRNVFNGKAYSNRNTKSIRWKESDVKNRKCAIRP